MTARVALWVVLLALAFMCGGCSDKVLGKYVVVDMDKTLAGITEVPLGVSKQMTLPEYRDHIRKQYADKTLEFTAQHPHEFLFSVPLEGTVQGLFHGGWMRDEKDKRTVLIYRWVSGSMYMLWGRGTLASGVLTVKLVDAPVIYLSKSKRGS